MNARMRRHGVLFRPHVKTAKCLQIARMINNGDVGPITVSTLREAEYFFEDGFDDILYAVSIIPAKLQRAKALIDRGCDLKFILDDRQVAIQVATAGVELGIQFQILIEIDCDNHRAGLEPDDPMVSKLASLLDSQQGVAFLGFMTHAGESYECTSTNQIKQHAKQEVNVIAACAKTVKQQGLQAAITSIGSTPTATFVDDLNGISEVRAGVYVFQDLFQVGLGVCQWQDIALSVLTTVVSHKPNNNKMIVDAGGLALSKDRSTESQHTDCHYGLVCEADTGELIDDLLVVGANQEHGLITCSKEAIDYSRFPIGTQLRILPNHACMTAAAHAGYYVVDGGDDVVDRWSRCNGW